MATYNYKDQTLGTVAIWIVGFVLVVALSFGCGAMTPESKAINALEDQGWTEVEVLEKDIFLIGFRGCDEKDNAKFIVNGINPAGEEREVFVCAGVFKGGTVRSN